MLDPSIVASTKELLEQKKSYRQIERLLSGRISRESIGRIARGERPDYESLQHARREQRQQRPRGILKRCPGCGGLVSLPCLLCELREKLAAVQLALSRFGDSDCGPLKLELRGEDHDRYCELRARKDREQAGELRLVSEEIQEAPEEPVYVPDEELLAIEREETGNSDLNTQ